ncbi:MAG TPA: cupin domain-containing protein [Thermodesulfobacteriota bacterium]|nr:cupin domain-containing protein [Thermodesulfobacteriota bacterium]
MAMEKTIRIFKIGEMNAVDRGPGKRGWPLLTDGKTSKHLTTGITEFQPGASLEMHVHNCEEQVTLLEGEATAIINGVSHHLRAPDTTFVSEGVPHRFINESDSLMKILWVYTSTHVTRTFVDTGKTEEYLKKQK